MPSRAMAMGLMMMVSDVVAVVALVQHDRAVKRSKLTAVQTTGFVLGCNLMGFFGANVTRAMKVK